MSAAAPTMFFCMDTTGGYDGEFAGENALVSAGLAYRNPGSGMFNIHVPDAESLMVDSGGFQAATRWNGARAGERGLHGRYPYSPQELHEWADEIGADVVAGMDVACEDAHELFDMEKGYIWPGDYQDRMFESLDNQLRQRRVYEAGDYDHEFMPVIQGKEVEDYENFIDLMQGEGLDRYDKLAIGTVCKRTNRDGILEVVRTVRDHYPEKYIHLFGATLNVWKDRRFHGWFDSSDTAAWNWGAVSKEHKKELYREYRRKVDDYTPDSVQRRNTDTYDAPAFADGGGR